MNGFGACTSDVDICLVVQNTEIILRERALAHLEEVKTCLTYCGNLFVTILIFITLNWLCIKKKKLIHSLFLNSLLNNLNIY